jgi:hypothetical protein
MCACPIPRRLNDLDKPHAPENSYAVSGLCLLYRIALAGAIGKSAEDENSGGMRK